MFDLKKNLTDRALVPTDRTLVPTDHALVSTDHALVPTDHALVPTDQFIPEIFVKNQLIYYYNLFRSGEK